MPEPEITEEIDFYPLTSKGIPVPGPDFLAAAAALGDAEAFENQKVPTGKGKKTKTQRVLVAPGPALEDLYRQALRQPGFTMPVRVRDGGALHDVSFVPGHIWGQGMEEYTSGRPGAVGPVDGPHPADVFVLSKMPGSLEAQEGRCWVGESGLLLNEILIELHVTGTPSWYVTNLLKFEPPDGSATLKAAWIEDCLPLLFQELLIVRPKYILCIGADASKALLGKKASVDAMDGRIAEFTYNVALPGEPDDIRTALVMTVLHPAAVTRAPEQRRRLTRGLARFDMLQRGIRWDLEETDVDHRVIRTLEDLNALLWEIDNDPEKLDNWISFDAEWHGEHPQNVGSYVRTMQIAWRPKHAACLVWADTTGKPVFVDEAGRPAQKRAIAALNKFFRNKRITGHFLVADLEWAMYIGLTELAKQFEVPLYDKPFNDFTPEQQEFLTASGFGDGDAVPAWVQTRWFGGADTGLMAHAIEETAQLGLEILATRYTTVPRYDTVLDQWKHDWCKEHGLKMKDLEGYGPVPDDVLLGYATYDADATLRLMYELMPLIDQDYEGNNCRESFWESMLTPPVILEMNSTGLPVSRERIDYNTGAFLVARTAQEKKIRDWANWPEFNIRSVQQVRQFLFGEEYNGKVSEDGRVVSVAPPGAESLNLTPILDTSKPPQQWAKIVKNNQQHERNAGTGKMVLGILFQENPDIEQIQWIRDYRFLDQVLKSLLRPPVEGRDQLVAATESEDDDAGPETGIGFGNFDNLTGIVYDAGLASVICDDGRVRTHFYPTTETKRWRSARPNLQNISKRRDPDYVRLLGGHKDDKGEWVGGRYKYKLRSLFHALPGHVLVEADFKAAELYLCAVLSGDKLMIEHTTRTQLSESDPNYYDIHSNVAVDAFGLKCLPTKKGLKSIGKGMLRIAAKNVCFGNMYDRSAAAIALQCKEEGNPISVDDAQRLKDSLNTMYATANDYLEAAGERAVSERWICGCFGAYRRFPYTTDRTLSEEFKRQGRNFPIQNGVASAMDRGLAYLRDYRDNHLKDPNFFKFALQMHDAGLFHVPYANVERFITELLPLNLCQRVAIYPTQLDGQPTGTGPYHFGIDVEVFQNWGEEISEEFCEEHGIVVPEH